MRNTAQPGPCSVLRAPFSSGAYTRYFLLEPFCGAARRRNRSAAKSLCGEPGPAIGQLRSGGGAGVTFQMLRNKHHKELPDPFLDLPRPPPADWEDGGASGLDGERFRVVLGDHHAALKNMNHLTSFEEFPT